MRKSNWTVAVLTRVAVLAASILVLSFAHSSTLTQADYWVLLESDDTTEFVAPGRTATFLVTVTNLGSSTDTILLTNSTPPVNWDARLSQARVYLDPGKMTDVTLNVTAPPDAPNGMEAHVNVTGTSTGDPSIQDSIETITIVEEIPEYALDLMTLEGAKEVPPGGEALFNITVKNVGALADVVDITYEDIPPDWLTSNPPPPISLDPDASQTFSLNVTAPATARMNDKAEIKVVGTSEGNSSVSDSVTAVTVVKKPNTYGVDIFTSDACEVILPSGSADYTLVVVNKGSVADTIDLNYTNRVTGWVYQLVPTSVGLNVDQSSVVNLTVTPPVNASPGSSDVVSVHAVSRGDSSVRDQTLILSRVAVPPTADAGSDRTGNEGASFSFNGSNSHSEEEPESCFLEDFEDQNPDDWYLAEGSANIRNDDLGFGGQYVLEIEARGTEKALVLNNNPLALGWTNYEMRADVRFEDGSDPLSVLDIFFYSQSAISTANSYHVSLSAAQDTASIIKTVGLVETILGTSSRVIDFNVTYSVDIRLQNERISLSIDGFGVSEVYDATYSLGTFGISTSTGGGAQSWVKSRFDNIEVVAYSSPELVTYSWDFNALEDLNGDGNATNDAEGSGPVVSHVFGDNGAYTVTLTVKDQLGLTGHDSVLAVVSNLPPAASVTVSPQFNEGDSVTFTANAADPGSDDLTFKWSWGDGTTSGPNVYYNDGASPDPPNSPRGTFPFNVTDVMQHIYADDSNYSIVATVTDDDGGQSTATASVIINNVAPAVEAGSDISTWEGSFVTISSINFDDPGFDFPPAGTLEDFTATVDWGDGIVKPVSVNEVPGSPGVHTHGTVSGSHAYADNGIYTVTVIICDDDGGCGADSFVVTVANVRPTVNGGSDLDIDEGGIASLEANFSDPGFDWPLRGTVEDFNATIDWGDGTFSNGNIVEYLGAEGVPTTGKATSSHIYGDNGFFTVTVTVCDDDGGCSSDTITVTSINVPPAIQPFCPYTVDETTPFSAQAMAN